MVDRQNRSVGPEGGASNPHCLVGGAHHRGTFRGLLALELSDACPLTSVKSSDTCEIGQASDNPYELREISRLSRTSAIGGVAVIPVAVLRDG